MYSEEVKAAAAHIRECDKWTDCWEDAKLLCEEAGLGEALKEADSETFESVIFEAAESLGVEIL